MSAPTHRTPLEQRFWHKVDKNGPVPEHYPALDRCWLWIGGRVGQGYGRLPLPGHQTGEVRAHRYSWELHNGSIPSDRWVLHRCDNPPCVRPQHLFLGTARDNTLDMISKGRFSGGFRQGHPYYRSRLTKLSHGVAIQIRALAEAGVEQLELARQFGVSSSTINKIVSGRSWI